MDLCERCLKFNVRDKSYFNFETIIHSQAYAIFRDSAQTCPLFTLFLRALGEKNMNRTIPQGPLAGTIEISRRLELPSFYPNDDKQASNRAPKYNSPLTVTYAGKESRCFGVYAEKGLKDLSRVVTICWNLNRKPRSSIRSGVWTIDQVPARFSGLEMRGAFFVSSFCT